MVGLDSARIPLAEPDGDRYGWVYDYDRIRRAYIDAPPSAHAPRHAREGRVRGLTPTQVWIDDVEVTDHVRSVDLNPTIETTSYGPTNWRETISGLRSGSMSLSGIFEWPAATLDDWIAANPAVGERVDPASVTDWVEGQGLQLDRWQRQMLDVVYSAPQPRLFGSRRASIQVGEHEINVEYSPMVPEGQVIVVSAAMMESMRAFGERLTEGFREAGQGIRVFLDSLSEAVKPALGLVGELKTLKRERMRKHHRLYRSRQLARRRRNR